MRTRHRLAVVGLAALVVVGVGIPVVSGATVSDVTADPVSTFAHVCDQWGLHNNWGTHQHGDHWSDHPHQGSGGPHGPHDPGQEPHGPHDPGQEPHGPHR